MGVCQFALKVKINFAEGLDLLRRVVDEVLIGISFIFIRFSQGWVGGFSLFRKLHLPIWYHDFSALGIKTRVFRGEGYDLSQQDKEPILFSFIERAAEIVKVSKKCDNSSISLVDLFCADAYYSLFALHRGFVDSVVGVDVEGVSGEGIVRDGVLAQADIIATMCGIQEQIIFNKGDVMEYEGVFDICLCLGGLYHIADPLALLRRVTAQTRHVLVIQTVIPSHIDENAPYFVSPAPHWTWGSRFNKKYLTEALDGLGWTVSAVDVRPMRANLHGWDKLSLSLLCVKDTVKA